MPGGGPKTTAARLPGQGAVEFSDNIEFKEGPHKAKYRGQPAQQVGGRTWSAFISRRGEGTLKMRGQGPSVKVRDDGSFVATGPSFFGQVTQRRDSSCCDKTHWLEIAVVVGAVVWVILGAVGFSAKGSAVIYNHSKLAGYMTFGTGLFFLAVLTMAIASSGKKATNNQPGMQVNNDEEKNP